MCDLALEHLHQLASELRFEVRVLDIADHPGIAERYRDVVPVVQAGGLTLLSGRFGVDELRHELERAFGPNPLRGVPVEEGHFLHVLCCPSCDGPLESRPRAVACLRCGREYERRGGVLMLQVEPERESHWGPMDLLGRLLQFRLGSREEGQ
ncbi:MAG: glutaredoxin family protein [Chloroflexota bacterium]|nr:glutaredoxin family protein [Chloroflexota bacterium]